MRVKEQLGHLQDGTGKAATQNDGAACLPLEIWANMSSAAKLVWEMKWTGTGLMPTRPIIVLADDVTVPAESSVLVTHKL